MPHVLDRVAWSLSKPKFVSIGGQMTTRSCPQCRSTKIRLSPSRSLADRCLRFFTIYYLRCQLCAYRFPVWIRRRLLPTRRSYERLAVIYPVWFRLASAPEESPTEEGTLLNLTIRGCRIRTEATLPLGVRLALEFQPSPYGLPITVDGAVVRSSDSGTAGLRFVKLARCEERRIGRVMDLYLKEAESGCVSA